MRNESQVIDALRDGRPRLSRAVTDTDAAIGARVRQHRMMLGWSAQRLATAAGLPLGRKMVLIQLAEHYDGRDVRTCRPSIARLAGRCDMSQKKRGFEMAAMSVPDPMIDARRRNGAEIRQL